MIRPQVIQSKTILLVEDDEELRQSLVEQFALSDEYAVTAVATAGAALAAVDRSGVDLVLMDVGLPDMDGREACRLMRKNGIKVPIIMLTAAASDADAILGLDSGANDYVIKPVTFNVLLARLRAHLRQHEQSEDASFTVGPYTFKPAAKILINTETNKKIWLTDKETAILKFLKRAQGQAVSRDVLLGEVWGYNAGVTTHTLETHVYRLRQKIEKNPSDAQLLVTESGGYKLVG